MVAYDAGRLEMFVVYGRKQTGKETPLTNVSRVLRG